MARYKPKTAQEWEEDLANDPEYQAMMRQKVQELQELADALRRDEAPLVEALRSVGRKIEGREIQSAWDLVNTAESYPDLLPILAEHLGRNYDLRIREGIARALAVKEARNAYVPRVLLEELKRQTDPSQGINSFRWALINTLVFIGHRSMAPEVRELLLDPRYESVKLDLNRLHRKLCRAKQ
jgi:hypothetical protein